VTSVTLSADLPRQAREEAEFAVRFQSVSKRFALHHERARSFQDLWIRSMRRVRADRWEEFWALREITFDVRSGEMLGVIGTNGSGKSTLLRLAARTIRPTSGQILMRGRVVPLLELGAGFHPELTGEDNVYLNGELLGLSREAIRARFDDIVAFAELEHFIDTPMKHYSSGMWIRLGFAVAAHADADVLLVDEALAVGDAAFQAKCLERIAGFRAEGKTILFVTHQLEQVARLCDRALWLDHGVVRMLGQADQVVEEYVAASVVRDGHQIELPPLAGGRED
jgi:ABC-type polysaccharide/polyol phosphate transport system ATPase subunit